MVSLLLVAAKTEEGLALAAVNEGGWNVGGAGGIPSKMAKALCQPLPVLVLRQTPTSYAAMDRALKISVRSKQKKWEMLVVWYHFILFIISIIDW